MLVRREKPYSDGSHDGTGYRYHIAPPPRVGLGSQSSEPWWKIRYRGLELQLRCKTLQVFQVNFSQVGVLRAALVMLRDILFAEDTVQYPVC